VEGLIMKTTRSLRTAALLALFPVLACAHASAARAQDAPDGIPDTVTVVTVERVKPQKEKYATLRFLKANRDFIRSRYDLVKEQSRSEVAAGGEIDARFLAYRRMLADIVAAKDSVSGAEDARAQQQLLASVQDLGRVEGQLDQMGRLLGDQQVRLATIERDFTGRQRTELAIVLSAQPGAPRVSQVTLGLDDRGTLSIPLTPEQSDALARQGIVQLFHGRIEPREQLIELGIGTSASPASGWITLDPARDRLTFLRLDVPAAGSASGTVRATTWLYETGLVSNERTETAP
jgi:hypothetical protein